MARRRLILAASAIALAAAAAAAGDGAREPTVHTVFTTECGRYFSWQSQGLVYSHRAAGQPGRLTRLLSCTPAEWAALPAEDRAVAPTHVAPSFTVHPRTGDAYSAYNKPAAVIDWLARTDVTEDYVLIIDADMIMRAPLVPREAGAAPGTAVAAFFGYMKGVANALAEKHVPFVAPRNDTRAGPAGRRGDQVGGFTLMATDDLRRMAPLWLKYTEDVRADPDAWELSGDAYSTHPGDKPWISEMYGYSFGAAAAGVWHATHATAMLYPGYEVTEEPAVLHYGLLWEVPGTPYKFDKHWHYDFDSFKCPPWDLSDPKSKAKGGLFPHAPAPGDFKTAGASLLRDLLAVEVPITLNAAFCERHRARCEPSAQLDEECGRADALAAQLAARLAEARAGLPDPCSDGDARCAGWAASGECESNPSFMHAHCALACKRCTPRGGGGGGGGGTPQLEHAEGGGAGGGGEGEPDADDDGDDGDDPAAMAEAEEAAADAAADEEEAEQEGDDEERVQLVGPRRAAGGGAARRALEARCTARADWPLAAVKECLRAAAEGREYEYAAGGGAGGAGQHALAWRRARAELGREAAAAADRLGAEARAAAAGLAAAEARLAASAGAALARGGAALAAAEQRLAATRAAAALGEGLHRGGAALAAAEERLAASRAAAALGEGLHRGGAALAAAEQRLAATRAGSALGAGLHRAEERLAASRVGAVVAQAGAARGPAVAAVDRAGRVGLLLWCCALAALLSRLARGGGGRGRGGAGYGGPRPTPRKYGPID